MTDRRETIDGLKCVEFHLRTVLDTCCFENKGHYLRLIKAVRDAERLLREDEQMNGQYEAVAIVDGKVYRSTGTMQECSNWADNFLRSQDGCGKVEIDIRRKE